MSKLSLSSSSLSLHNQYPNISSSIAIVRPREREIAYFNRVKHLRATWDGERGTGGEREKEVIQTKFLLIHRHHNQCGAHMVVSDNE